MKLSKIKSMIKLGMRYPVSAFPTESVVRLKKPPSDYAVKASAENVENLISAITSLPREIEDLKNQEIITDSKLNNHALNQVRLVNELKQDAETRKKLTRLTGESSLETLLSNEHKVKRLMDSVEFTERETRLLNELLSEHYKEKTTLREKNKVLLELSKKHDLINDCELGVGDKHKALQSLESERLQRLQSTLQISKNLL